VKDNQFKSNEDLKKLIKSQSYLSEDEIVFKHELEESLRKFFEFNDEFAHMKTQIESDVYNHFDELRFQVDEQRERLKERIDEIALAMIDKLKKHEVLLSKNLKERFSSFYESQSLENELSQIEETFRDPNLLIKTIKEMQHKQEESLKDIQLKLNEIKQVKDNLEATNFFKPNLSSFNQTEGDISLFGSIRLNEYSNMNSFRSEIFTNQQQCSELIKLCEFSPNDKWSLLYRGSWDGFGSNAFHSKSDGKLNTLTLLKAKQSSYIFGGFTTVSWDSSSGYKSDPNAFIFSLTNKDRKPVKMKVDPDYDDSAICCNSFDGPTFGCDICIANNANTTMDSWSNLGNCYNHPQYEEGTNEAKTFLAGSYEFQLDEIEVYQKE